MTLTLTFIFRSLSAGVSVHADLSLRSGPDRTLKVRAWRPMFWPRQSGSSVIHDSLLTTVSSAALKSYQSVSLKGFFSSNKKDARNINSQTVSRNYNFELLLVNLKKFQF